MREIGLSQGGTATVDDEDYESLSAFTWAGEKSKRSRVTYAVRKVRGEDGVTRSSYLHREVMGFGPGDPEVDHADGNGLNCRRCNLRAATRSQNKANQACHRDSKSGFKGVSFSSRASKYYARAVVDARTTYLGLYDNVYEAALAYNIAASIFFGDFSWGNDIPPEFLPTPDRTRSIASSVRHRIDRTRTRQAKGLRGNGTDGLRGVSRKRGRNTWVARVSPKGSSIRFGNYESRYHAAFAYNCAAPSILGPDTPLNAIPDADLPSAEDQTRIQVRVRDRLKSLTTHGTSGIAPPEQNPAPGGAA